MVIDTTKANQAILRTRRTLPTTEEILCELEGAQFFSKVDMRAAYQQITSPEVQILLRTKNDHRGCYKGYHAIYMGYHHCGIGPRG